MIWIVIGALWFMLNMSVAQYINRRVSEKRLHVGLFLCCFIEVNRHTKLLNTSDDLLRKSMLVIILWMLFFYFSIKEKCSERIFFFFFVISAPKPFFCYFCTKTYLVGTLWHCHTEAIPMSTHKINNRNYHNYHKLSSYVELSFYLELFFILSWVKPEEPFCHDMTQMYCCLAVFVISQPAWPWDLFLMGQLSVSCIILLPDAS